MHVKPEYVIVTQYPHQGNLRKLEADYDENELLLSRRKRGYAGDLTPPSKNLIPSHANSMQHVLRCWETQSDGLE